MNKIHTRAGYLVIYFISCFLMLIGFYFNFFKAALPGETENFGKISESLVVGRLAETQRNGLFSAGGFLGFAMQQGDSVAQPKKQYQIYIEQLPYESYSIYRTITGFNGFMFGMIDELTGFPNIVNLKLFWLINSMLLSLLLALILLFILYYAGFTAYLLTLCSVIFSPVLTAFGPNLFFALWAFYFPLIIVMLILVYEDITGKYSHKMALFLIFTAIIIKGFFNGFEFITTTLVMMMTPLFFFMIKNDWSLKFFLGRFFSYSIIAIIGVILNLAILAGQITIHDNSVKSGVNHIFKSWHKRTSAVNRNYNFDQQVSRSLESKVSNVINSQMKSVAYKIYPKIPLTINSSKPWKIKYSGLLMVFGASTIILLFLKKYFSSERATRIAIATLIMAWISILAPFSWFIIFKGHTFIHQNLDNLAWFLPFVIFGAAVSGLTIKVLYLFLFSRINKN